MQAPAVTYPAAFGHWHLRGGTLQCRLPRKTVQVAAPAGLLADVARLCDGRLAWREVAAELAQAWDPAQVDGFLRGLCDEGVLVESGELLAHWIDLGHAPALSAPVAGAEELAEMANAADARLLPGAGPGPAAGRLPTAANHLAKLLRRRTSGRTYADVPLAAGALRSILWAAGGVTRPGAQGRAHHRTVASGGNLHGMRWFVLVLRPLPDGDSAVPMGLHEAQFHAEGGCTLALRASGTAAAWHLLRDPRVLQFASAILLPVAQVRTPARKYGNRGTVFAHIEAGQSLQNAQLMACALGAACVVRGDTFAAQVQRLLAPHVGASGGPLLPMPSCVVGSAPSTQQVVQQRTEAWVALHPCAGAPDRGPAVQRHAWTAGPIRSMAGEIHTVGRAADPRVAIVKAEAEAWERLGWATLSGGTRARMRDVAGAVDPKSLVSYTPRQYARQDFPFAAFDPRRDHLWLPGRDAGTGRTVHVTADHVHAHAALPVDLRARALTSSSTSGVAAWSTPAQALERATLELVERDAFTRSWIAGAALPCVNQRTLPAQARARIRALAQAGHRVAVLRLPCDLAAVFAVFLQRTDPPWTAITAAADFDAEAALHKALDEAEGRAGLSPAAVAPAIALRDVRTPQDISRWWQLPRVFRRADWYASGAATQRFTHPALPACADWQSLLARLQAAGRTVLAVDITPSGASIHQGRTPLHVVRAFVPGTLPIWFGHGFEPAGLAAYASARAQRGDRRGATACVPLHPFT